MKKFIVTSLATALTLTLMSSCDGKKSNTEEVKTAKDTIAWEGTYSTLGDVPGRALIVDLEDDGTYSFWKKEYGNHLSILSTDSIEWNAEGNQLTVKDGAGQAYTFELTPEALVFNGDSLRKVDVSQYVGSIDNLYQSTYKAYDGSMMSVKVSSNATNLIAYVKWSDMNMTLTTPANKDVYSVGSLTFSSDEAKLTLNIADETATIEINGKTVKFVLVDLISQEYKAISNGDDSISYDVTFINPEDSSYVMLQDKNNAIIILPQTEAWSKGASYAKGEYMFDFNKEKATLVLPGQEPIKMVHVK